MCGYGYLKMARSDFYFSPKALVDKPAGLSPFLSVCGHPQFNGYITHDTLCNGIEDESLSLQRISYTCGAHVHFLTMND